MPSVTIQRHTQLRLKLFYRTYDSVQIAKLFLAYGANFASAKKICNMFHTAAAASFAVDTVEDPCE